MQNRRRFVSLACGVGVGALLPLSSIAQTFPSRPIRFIVPFAPGGSADVLSRLIGQHMSQQLGQP